MPNYQDTNTKTMRHFVSQFREHISALSSLDINVMENNPVLTTLILRKFDVRLRTRFEAKRNNKLYLPIEKFIQFLEDECLFTENVHLTNSNAQSSCASSQNMFSGKQNPKCLQTFLLHKTDQGRVHIAMQKI